MRVDAFHFDLPPELIAQHPEPERENARLMVVAPGKPPEHHRVSEFPDLLPSGSLVVLNDTRVIPARLLGRKRGTGGRVEVLLVRRVEDRTVEDESGRPRRAQVWRALGKASKPLKFGADIEVAPRTSPDDEDATAVRVDAAPPRTDGLVVRLLGRADDGLLEVALWTPSGQDVTAALHACGHVPLPPYIKREDSPEDAARYQTVYARHDGAVAAPTAGLHVTNAMLGRLAVRGCEIATVTLHVGLGTFQPVQVEDLDQHPMHAERYVITPTSAAAITRARDAGAPVVGVGTTTVRAVESAADPEHPGLIRAADEETRLLIQPGYRFRVIDVLLTNFHLPRSTLLALVCAFGGTETVMNAYRVAVEERYRFFSYGDAMLLWRAR